MEENKKFFITSAICYASKIPHIGNVYEIILTDCIARFKRNMGYNVFFLTGTDEHGQKIELEALQKNIIPKQHVDIVTDNIIKIYKKCNISYDKFIRTTDQFHIKSVQKIFEKLYKQGDIYKGTYEGWYCTTCENFLTQTQIVQGNCPECGQKVVCNKEEAYFLKIGKYRDSLLKFYEENPNFIEPTARRQEIINLIKSDLPDLCVTRSCFNWGIKVSFDEKHLIYVWLDALSNYITALGFDPSIENSEYQKFWPADLHVIGKDILKFHAIYWLVMLMALGLPMPKKIFAHPWLLMGSNKMSKSTGNVVYTDFLIKHFGVDAVRYIVLSEMPYLSDGSINFETIIEKYNSCLANSFGNLISRVTVMGQKYFDGTVINTNENNSFDQELKNACENCLKQVSKYVDEFKISIAVREIWKLINCVNKYVDETTPWNLSKDEISKTRLQTVIYNLLESSRFIAALISPFMPETSNKISKILGACVSFESIKKFGFVKEYNISNLEALFQRINVKEKLNQIYLEIENKDVERYCPEDKKMSIIENELNDEVINSNKEHEKNSETKEYLEKKEPSNDTTFEKIDISYFKNIDIRVGKVLECEKVPKSSKLLKFILESGNEKRQILSGISKYYSPEKLIGKNVLFISNLKTTKIMGYESNGMILSAVDEENVSIATVLDDIKSGARVS